MTLHWYAGQVLVTSLLRLLGRFQVRGRERLLPGPQILAVNHVSNFDPLIVCAAARREVHFMAKEELFTASRAFAWLIRTFNAHPVRRGGGDPAAIKYCSRLLQRRQTVVLFPEGTRSKTGEMARFKPGIGMLAVANKVPVVPAHMRGVEGSMMSYLTDTDFVRHGFRHKPAGASDIRVAFAEPVSPDGFAAKRQGYEALTRVVEERVRELEACGW